MKKLMMIAAMMVATMTASAQFEPGTFSLQPKLGGTGTMLSDMPKLPLQNIDGTVFEIDKSATGGFIIGAEAEYQFTKMLSLAAGVNYAEQGSGWKDTKIVSSGVSFDLKDTKVALSYINIPVVANVYLFKGFALKAGVQLGFLTSAKMKVKAEGSENGLTQRVEIDENIKSSCNKTDFSIPVGLSYQFKVPIVIDARYNIGLSKVNNKGNEKSKNQVFQITVGYKFAL